MTPDKPMLGRFFGLDVGDWSLLLLGSVLGIVLIIVF